jgi:hypothetical protein
VILKMQLYNIYTFKDMDGLTKTQKLLIAAALWIATGFFVYIYFTK